MSRSYAILGAGLMGRMMAYALAKDGAVIALFERSGPDAEQSAARVAASMLAPLAESAITEPSVVRMALKHGAGFVRVMFLLVVSALICKTSFDAYMR